MLRCIFMYKVSMPWGSSFKILISLYQSVIPIIIIKFLLIVYIETNANRNIIKTDSKQYITHFK